MPETIWASLLRLKPSVNSRPSPPKPITAPTVTRLIVDTAATRRPATITGTASGSSTPTKRRTGV